MRCPAWEESLALAAGGDLEDARRLELERHLAECAACREFAGEMAECRAALGEAREAEPAPAHFAAVRARVLERLQRDRALEYRVDSAGGRAAGAVRCLVSKRWLWIAAACAAIALLALWRLPWGRPQLAPPRIALARPEAPLLHVAAAPPATNPARHARPVRRPERVLIKIETDNPDVVIYWIAN